MPLLSGCFPDPCQFRRSQWGCPPAFPCCPSLKAMPPEGCSAWHVCSVTCFYPREHQLTHSMQRVLWAGPQARVPMQVSFCPVDQSAPCFYWEPLVVLPCASRRWLCDEKPAEVGSWVTRAVPLLLRNIQETAPKLVGAAVQYSL